MCLCRYVRVSMEALDTLLVTCHAQSLNLFVESYLKMVQKLVECNEPDMQCLATASVCKLFASSFFRFKKCNHMQKDYQYINNCSAIYTMYVCTINSSHTCIYIQTKINLMLSFPNIELEFKL